MMTNNVFTNFVFMIQSLFVTLPETNSNSVAESQVEQRYEVYMNYLKDYVRYFICGAHKMILFVLRLFLFIVYNVGLFSVPDFCRSSISHNFF